MSTVRSVAPLLNSARSPVGTLNGASSVASTSAMNGAPSDDAARLMARINERLDTHAQLLETIFDVRRQLAGKLSKKDRRMLSAVEAGKLAASAKLEAEINFLRTELLAFQLRQVPAACMRCRVGRVDVRIEDDSGGQEWLCRPCGDAARAQELALLAPPRTPVGPPRSTAAAAPANNNNNNNVVPPVISNSRRVSSVISGVQGLAVDLNNRPSLCEQCTCEPPTALVKLLSNGQSLFTCHSCATDITERLARNMPLAPRGQRPPPLPPLAEASSPPPSAAAAAAGPNKRLPPTPVGRPVAPTPPTPDFAPPPVQPQQQPQQEWPSQLPWQNVLGMLSSRARPAETGGGSERYMVDDWTNAMPPPPLAPGQIDGAAADGYQALPLDGYRAIPANQVGPAAFRRPLPTGAPPVSVLPPPPPASSASPPPTPAPTPMAPPPLTSAPSVPQFRPIAAPAELANQPSGQLQRPQFPRQPPTTPQPQQQQPPQPPQLQSQPQPQRQPARLPPPRYAQPAAQPQRGGPPDTVARAPAATNAPPPARPMPGGVLVQGGETIPARMILEQSTGYMWGRVRAPNTGPLIFVPDQLRGGAVDGNVVLLKVKMSTTKSAGKLYGRVVMILPDT